MEEFKNLDFYDESTDLHFHKLNPNIAGEDFHFYSLLNTWKSENIKKFLSRGPLGDSMQPESRSDSYVIQNGSMEVVGCVRLFPNTAIIGHNELTKYATTPPIKNSDYFLSLENARDLLKADATGLYISSFATNPNQPRKGFGTRILNAIAQNATLFNRNKKPLCTMAMVESANEFSKKAFEKANFLTLPYDATGLENFYKINDFEL